MTHSTLHFDRMKAQRKTVGRVLNKVRILKRELEEVGLIQADVLNAIDRLEDAHGLLLAAETRLQDLGRKAS